MQSSVAEGGYLLTGLAIHAVTHPLQVPLWIDLTSVVVAALAGAFAAVEERFDPVGVILLAVIMDLGGGDDASQDTAGDTPQKAHQLQVAER